MKQLLIKVLPNFFIGYLVKQKYRTRNIEIHKQNIQLGNLVEVKCLNNQRYNNLKKIVKKSFGALIDIDIYTLYFYPIAVIKIPKNIDIYLKLIGAKSRNMNKKAEKNGIDCKVIEWNNYLEDIYKINTSSQVRQGREMDKVYLEYPKKVTNEDIEDFKIRYIGAFKDNILVGYIELYIYGNFAMTNRILGHRDYLKYGVMNLMIKKCVEYGIDNKIEYINYLSMLNKRNNSLSAFKYRVGFREYSLLELK